LTTRLILVSHAVTQWNIEGRIQGHTDVPLNRQGKKMAELLAERLAEEIIGAIYTSDLKRAVQTAEPISKQKSIKIIQDIRLREGRSINQERSDTYPTLPFPLEVETKTDLYRRATEALTQIAMNHQNQTVLVVSHGGLLDIFITALLEKSENKLLQYKGKRMALNQIKYNLGHWHCITLNEDAFLKNKTLMIKDA